MAGPGDGDPVVRGRGPVRRAGSGGGVGAVGRPGRADRRRV